MAGYPPLSKDPVPYRLTSSRAANLAADICAAELAANAYTLANTDTCSKCSNPNRVPA
jgi:hypothetical protein